MSPPSADPSNQLLSPPALSARPVRPPCPAPGAFADCVPLVFATPGVDLAEDAGVRYAQAGIYQRTVDAIRSNARPGAVPRKRQDVGWGGGSPVRSTDSVGRTIRESVDPKELPQPTSLSRLGMDPSEWSRESQMPSVAGHAFLVAKGKPVETGR